MVNLYHQWSICRLRPFCGPLRAVAAAQGAACRPSKPGSNANRTEAMVARKRARVLKVGGAYRTGFHFIVSGWISDCRQNLKNILHTMDTILKNYIFNRDPTLNDGAFLEKVTLSYGAFEAMDTLGYGEHIQRHTLSSSTPLYILHSKYPLWATTTKNIQ